MVRIFVNCDKLVGDEDAWQEMHFDSLLTENKLCVWTKAESALLILIFPSGNCFISFRSRVKLAQGERFFFSLSLPSCLSLPPLHSLPLSENQTTSWFLVKRRRAFWGAFVNLCHPALALFLIDFVLFSPSLCTSCPQLPSFHHFLSFSPFSVSLL